MKISKDEARILAAALHNFKFEVNDRHQPGVFDALKKLEEKLDFFGKDQRRTGRTSQDDWSDCLKRYGRKVK